MAKHKPRYIRKKARRKLPALVFVLVMLLAATGIWGVSAKYTQQQEGDALVKAKEFYFTSDLLMVGGKTYELSPGTGSVTFALRSRVDALRYSEDAVQYTVTASGGTLSTASGTLSTEDAVITLSGLTDGGSYTVTAVGEAGYEKTLSATFVVKSGDTGIYKHLDTANGAYVLLTVWTKNSAGDVRITFPDGLIPDTTDPNLKNIVNFDGMNYKSAGFDQEGWEIYSSRTYRFFKADPSGIFSAGDFSVTLNGEEAAAATP